MQESQVSGQPSGQSRSLVPDKRLPDVDYVRLPHDPVTARFPRGSSQMDFSDVGGEIIVINSFVRSFPNRIQAHGTQNLVVPRGSQRNHFEIPERRLAAFSARTLYWGRISCTKFCNAAKSSTGPAPRALRFFSASPAACSGVQDFKKTPSRR